MEVVYVFCVYLNIGFIPDHVDKLVMVYNFCCYVITIK